MKILILTILIALLTSCANYKPGDASRVYCTTTDSVLRDNIAKLLEDNGVVLGVDYCDTFNVVDAVIINTD